MGNNNTNKMLKNSLFLYMRMILLMGIGFYTTRVILDALGVEDLGIQNVVGSLVVMFDFVSSGLSNATQRYLNIGLGREDKNLTNQYFSQSLTIHLLFGLSLFVIIEVVGLWLLYNYLVIPPCRFEAALWCFHIANILLVLRLIKICFESDIIAREKMSIYAYLSLFEGIAKLLICYIIIYNQTFDRLILYSILLLLVNTSVTGFNIIYCLTKFEETHFKWFVDLKVYKELLGFVGTNSFGVLSWALGKQGVDLVINMFFGPAVNGAKAIASNLDRVVSQFGSNLELAVRPQITKLYAQDNRQEMIDLGMRTAKLVYFVMMLIATPFLFQTEGILSLWLKDVPDFTAGFVRILIIETLLYCIGNSFFSVTVASGKIKRTQVYGRLITLSTFPISYIFVNFWNNEFLPSVILVVTSFLYSLFIIWDANTIYHFGLGKYFKKVYIPIIVVTTISFLSTYIVIRYLSFSNTRYDLLYTIPFCGIIELLIIYTIGISSTERQYVNSLIREKNPFRRL